MVGTRVGGRRWIDGAACSTATLLDVNQALRPPWLVEHSVGLVSDRFRGAVERGGEVLREVDRVDHGGLGRVLGVLEEVERCLGRVLGVGRADLGARGGA